MVGWKIRNNNSSVNKGNQERNVGIYYTGVGSDDGVKRKKPNLGALNITKNRKRNMIKLTRIITTISNMH